MKEKSLDDRVHMFSVTVGSSKTVYEQEQLSVEIRAKTLMPDVITLKLVHQLTQQTFYFQLKLCSVKLA